MQRTLIEVTELILSNLETSTSDQGKQLTNILYAILTAVASINNTTNAVSDAVNGTTNAINTTIPQTSQKTSKEVLDHLDSTLTTSVEHIINEVKIMSLEQRKQLLNLCLLLIANHSDIIEILKQINSKLTPPEPVIIEKEVIVEKKVPYPVPVTIEEYEKKIRELKKETERICGELNKVNELNRTLKAKCAVYEEYRPKFSCCL